jgi:hypothetical protein
LMMGSFLMKGGFLMRGFLTEQKLLEGEC